MATEYSCKVDLSMPTESFNWLNTDGQQAWMELAKLGSKRREKSFRVIVGTDVCRWALDVPNGSTVLQLKEMLCSRRDLFDLRVDQVTLITDERGFLQDAWHLSNVGITDLSFVGVLVSCSKTVVLKSSVDELLDEYKNTHDPDAKMYDMDVHVLTTGHLCLVRRVL
jgi:hypothetical protein